VFDARAHVLPAIARVLAAPQSLIEGSTVHLLRTLAIDGEALRLAPHHLQVHRPFTIVLRDYR